MADVYSFPLLKGIEIIECLNDLGIPFSSEELSHPTRDTMRPVYDTFVELLMGVSRADMMQPQFGELEFFGEPDLYENSIGEVKFSLNINKLMEAVGIYDFNIKDVLKPNKQRTREILSAIINFAKFREDRLIRYQELTEQTDGYLERELQLREAKGDIENEIQQAQTKLALEQPEVDRLEAETNALIEEVGQLNVRQAQLKKDVADKKAIAEQVKDTTANTKFTVLQVRQECETKRSQIVSSPEKLQGKISNMRQTVQNDRQDLADAQAKSAKLQRRIAGIETATAALRETMALVDQVNNEIARLGDDEARLEDLRRDAEEHKENLEEAAAQERLLTRQATTAQEKLTRAQQQSQLKTEESSAALMRAKAEEAAMQQTNLAMQTQIAENRARAAQLRAKIDDVRAAHADDMDRLGTCFEDLRAQVKTYHRKLEVAMADAS